MAGRGFIIFWIFLLFFFRNFLARVEYERNSGVKFYFLFFSLSPPVLAKNFGGKRFYNFSNFFTIFFRNFLARVEYERNSGLNFFFFSFLVVLIPFWPKLIPRRGFIIFWIFLLFFSQFSCSGRVWTEFWTKIFRSLFWPISSRFI